MALVVGQNSWASVAEANTYLTDRIYAEDWFNLDSSGDPGMVTKESLLVSSFNWLLGNLSFSLSSALTDDNVKNAQIEGTLFLLNHYVELDERRAAKASGVTEFKISQRMEKLDGDIVVPSIISDLLSSYRQGNIATLLGAYDV